MTFSYPGIILANFISSFSKCFLKAYYMIDIVLIAKDTKKDEVPVLRVLTFQWRKTIQSKGSLMICVKIQLLGMPVGFRSLIWEV